jgi:hypothetical protein
MSILTYLTQTQIDANKTELNGKVLTRPGLLVTDGLNVIYACDVDVGLTVRKDENDDAEYYLRNVPIARGNRDLIYAEVGAAVRLRRTASGQFEIVGFSQEMPGTYKRVPVDLDAFEIGQIEDVTLSSVAIPYGDLVYGTTPYGSIAVYRGTTLIKVTA